MIFKRTIQLESIVIFIDRIRGFAFFQAGESFVGIGRKLPAGLLLDRPHHLAQHLRTVIPGSFFTQLAQTCLFTHSHTNRTDLPPNLSTPAVRAFHHRCIIIRITQEQAERLPAAITNIFINRHNTSKPCFLPPASYSPKD